VPSYPDINGDGIDEYLLGVRGKEPSSWVFVSGKDFTVIKRVTVGDDAASGVPKLSCAGDLNGDGVSDLVAVNRLGARVNKEVSYLGALSGADGSWLWQIAGDALPGGPKRFAVSTKTGEKRELPTDVGFGERPTVLADLDGDGAREIACALPTVVEGQARVGVLVFSGATGKHLATFTLPERKGRLLGGQMLFIEKYDPDGHPALAVSGRIAKHKYMVAVFDLVKIRK